MALDDFDLAALLKRLGIFGDDSPAPSAPAWMTSPHQTISQPMEPTSDIPQIGGQPWYQASPQAPSGPAAGFQDESENDELLRFLSDPGPEGGVQGPQMEDIQVHQPRLVGPEPGDISWQQELPQRIQMPPLEVSGKRPSHYSLDVGEPQMPPQYDIQVGEPEIDSPETRKRKAALLSIGGP